MKKKLKIDEIYREKFRGVESPPPADLWENILARLPEKKKKRILPLWYTIAGTAAAIVLIFLISMKDYLNSSTSNQIAKIATQKFQPNSTSIPDHISPEFWEKMTTSSAILEAAALATQFEILKKEFQGNREQRSNKTLPSNELTSLLNGKNQISNQIKEVPDKTVPAPLAQLEEPIQKLENPSTAIEKKSEEITKVLPKKDVTLKEKEDLALNADEEQKEKEENYKVEFLTTSDTPLRFRVTPTAAAVYLDNFSGENLLDDQFSNKEGGGEISMSYGVNLAYQISEKINLRSGINKVNLAYNTKEINYGAALNSQAFDFDPDVISHAPDNPDNEVSPVGSLRQKIDFIEIPLEIEYVISNKKSGINLIGGFSTLFHSTNEVALSSSDFSANLGMANNINNLSFSVNAGIGFNYKITSRFQFNLEPIFKYQIKTFDNTSNQNSYYLGMYSGLSFKF